MSEAPRRRIWRERREYSDEAIARTYGRYADRGMAEITEG